MKGNVYKRTGNDAIHSEIREEIEKDIRENLDKFKDPVVLGELVYKLLRERETTNLILKNLLQRIEILEKRIGSTKSEPFETLIPEVDQEIVLFVREHGPVDAETVRKRFGYKGRNAASARLNRLCQLNLIRKKQVGRKVLFFV